MNTSTLWPSATIGAAVAAVLLAFGFPDSPLRPVVVLGFLLVCPGLSLVRPLQLAEGTTQLVLAVVLSLAIETALGLIMVYAHLWSPEVLLVLLAAGCVAASLAERAQALRPVVARQAAS